MIENVRSLLTGTPMGDNGWIALAWCCGLFLFSFLLATSLYRRRTRGVTPVPRPLSAGLAPFDPPGGYTMTPWSG